MLAALQAIGLWSKSGRSPRRTRVIFSMPKGVVVKHPEFSRAVFYDIGDKTVGHVKSDTRLTIEVWKKYIPNATFYNWTDKNLPQCMVEYEKENRTSGWIVPKVPEKTKKKILRNLKKQCKELKERCVFLEENNSQLEQELEATKKEKNKQHDQFNGLLADYELLFERFTAMQNVLKARVEKENLMTPNPPARSSPKSPAEPRCRSMNNSPAKRLDLMR